MIDRKRWIACLVLMLLGGSVPCAKGESTGAEGRTPLGELVQQLSSPRFSHRQQAIRSLLAAGPAARDVLERAAAQGDPYTELEAERLLARIREAELKQRIAAFAADVAGEGKMNLPGQAVVQKVLGPPRDHRLIYIEMLLAEPELLELADRDPPRALRACAERLEALQLHSTLLEFLAEESTTMTSREREVGTLASLLALYAASDALPDEDETHQLTSILTILLASPQLGVRLHNDPIWSDLSNLLAQWMRRETRPNLQYANLVLAAQHHLPVTIEIAEKLLATPELEANHYAIALLQLARDPDLARLDKVKPFFGDKRLVNQADQTVQIPNAEETSAEAREPIQLRDVALASALRLTGESLTDYGFTLARRSNGFGYDINSLSFESTKAREAAWERFRASHPEK